MPAGQDEELAALFCDLREALNASPEVLARQLDTTPDVILMLEQGNLLGLPPWPETDRIISSYAGLLGLDASPILRRIIAHLQSYAPSGGPTEPSAPPSPVEATSDPARSLPATEPPPSEPRPHPLELSSFSFELAPARNHPEPAPKTDPEPHQPKRLQSDPSAPAPMPSPNPKPNSGHDWRFEPGAPWKPADPQQPSLPRPTVETRHPGPRRPPEMPKQPPWLAAERAAANQNPAIPDRTNAPSPVTQPHPKRQAEPEVDASFDWTPAPQNPADPRPIAEPATAMSTASEPGPKSNEPKPTSFLTGLKPYITSPARLAAIVGVVITIWLIAGNSDRLFSGMPESLQWLTRGMDGDASDDPRNRKADRLPSRY